MSITATAPRASESNHWYTRDGVPQYTVEAAKGGQRNTTLRDARKMNLVPSVTTILNIAAKPGLTAWLQQQVLLAALTLPKKPEESDKEYCDRIIYDSKEQGRSAADAGTDIHAAIQEYYESQYTTRHFEHVKGCIEIIEKTFGKHKWIAERAFAHEMGFGGKCDLHAPGFVVDVKTKEFGPSDKVEGYDEHLMQLSAYRVGLGMPEARCANVFVSRTVPGLSVVKEWSEEELEKGWQMFTHLLMFWQLKNNHK